MDHINPERQLIEKIRHSWKTVSGLLEEYESLLQKQKSTETTRDSDHSVKPSPIIDDSVTKRLKDIDIALESNQQQLKLALEKYLTTQSALPTSANRSKIQSDDNQMKVAKIAINQQGKLSDGNKGRYEANLNPTALDPQAVFKGILPDDVYIYLMSVIGLQECLISNRLVCPYWNELVLERCSKQKSLKLFETFGKLMDYGEMLLQFEKTDDSSLILKSIGDDLLFEALETDHMQLVNSLNPEVILSREKRLEGSKVLTSLFPEIEELVLYTPFMTLINVEHLMQFYAEQLTSLTVNWSDYWREGKLGAFNFPKLKSLNALGFSPEDEQLLSLLPQLESLTLFRATMSLETLLRTGTQLWELNINDIDSVYTAPVAAFSRRPPINSKLRKFTLGYSDKVLLVLKFISQNLTSLECLKIDLRFGQNNFPRLHLLSHFLVPLQRLHSLTLEARVSFFLLDDTQLAQIRPLPSVRQLKLILCDFDSPSMNIFSRALFKAFPKVEQILIAFAGNSAMDSATIAAFEAFSGKHPNVVQLFRSKNMSKFTSFPNAVSPQLGQHRQVYEEYIDEVELFGVTIAKLTACLVTRQAEDGLNLKIALRAADRLTALSNLFQLLESDAFDFTFKMVRVMIRKMVEGALSYGPSQVALYTATCKCIFFLLGCSAAKLDMVAHIYLHFMLQLVEHYQKQQFKDGDFLLQLHHSTDKLVQMMFNSGKRDFMMSPFIGKNMVHRVETARSMLRVCSSAKNCFRSN